MTPLKMKRLEKGLKQIDLAVESGLQQSLICRYEKGQKPNKANAEKLSAALGCSPSEIFPDFNSLRDY